MKIYEKWHRNFMINKSEITFNEIRKPVIINCLTTVQEKQNT